MRMDSSDRDSVPSQEWIRSEIGDSGYAFIDALSRERERRLP